MKIANILEYWNLKKLKMEETKLKENQDFYKKSRECFRIEFERRKNS